MQNKKTIMSVSALLILIFHLWIHVTNLQIEIYLRQLCVIGVDLFFFVSAYSIAKKEKIEYKSFIISRFNKVYLKFILFSVIGALYFGWDIVKFIKIIFGIELIEKGGGSFLWFLPGIMLVYLILPLYKKIDSKYPKVTPFVTILLHLFLSIMISTLTTDQNLFILTNRIPMILLGYYFAKYDIFKVLNDNKVGYWITTIITFIIGVIISYLVYVNHFKVSWYKDLFYILYIPLSIGLILLLDKIRTNRLSAFIGSITLELYALQMIFGFRLANEIFQYTNTKLLSNILVVVVLVIMSIIIQRIFNLKDKLKLNGNKESEY